MRIAMIGSGYVGLVSGACLSEFGHSVVCVDKDESKIAALKKGSIPIFEPGLDDVVATNARAGRLTFTSECPNDRACLAAITVERALAACEQRLGCGA